MSDSQTVRASLPLAALSHLGRPRESTSTGSPSMVPSKRAAAAAATEAKEGTNSPQRRVKEEVDELEDDVKPVVDENINPHSPPRAKRVRPSLDSGYGPGDRSIEMEGVEIGGQTIKVEAVEEQKPTLEAGPQVLVPDSEDGDVERLLTTEEHASSGTLHSSSKGSAKEQGKGTERARPTTASRTSMTPMTDGAEIPLSTLEQDLLSTSTARAKCLEGLLELLTDGVAWTRDQCDERMLRTNLSYLDESLPERRAQFLARSGVLSDLQIKTDKRASLLSEIIDLKMTGQQTTDTGDDEEMLRHSLNFVEKKIRELRGASVPGISSPAVDRPAAPALPGPQAATHSYSPAMIPPMQIPQAPPFAPPYPQQRQSSVSSTSQASATVAAAARRRDGPSTRPNEMDVEEEIQQQAPSEEAVTSEIARFSHPSHVTLSSSEEDPVRPPGRRPQPAPAPALAQRSTIPAPQPRPTSAAAPATMARFRPAGEASSSASSSKAASVAAAPQPVPIARPQPATRQVTTAIAPPQSSKGKGRALPQDADVEALFDGVDWDEGMDVDDEDNLIMVAAAKPGRQQANPAHHTSSILPSTRQVAIVKPVGPVASTSTASSNDPARVSSAPKLTHPWSRDVAKALRQRFGLTGFRANQQEAIDATLGGRDVFVLLPTGGGKSLCFQLPAVVNSGKTRGVSIVVSPLLSLISDQTKALIDKDIPVVFLNSTMPAADRRFAMDCLRADPPEACLAYVTPEQIVKSGQFRDLLRDLFRRKQLARFVIDEAHCVSSWGHDFRPDYKEMGALKKDFPSIPLIALTATANSRVKEDVMVNLGMQRPLVLTQSFNRKNLRYEVRPKSKGVLGDIAKLINSSFKGKCGIIYCHSKKQCEDTADKLRKDYKISAMHYHAGMDKDDRLRIQDGWQQNEYHVICATIAFGMGIDKPDVRYVIHYSLSQSLEAYYQETGRAGRDGATSTCVLFFSYGDTKLINRLIDEGEGTPEQKETNRANVRRVVQYCMNETDCRRVQVLRYFGDNNFTAQDCHKTCDNCLAERGKEKSDVTALAQDAIRLVQSVEREKGITMLYAIDVFRGSKNQKIVAKGHDQLPYANKGKGMDRGDAERLFQLLASELALGERFERNALGFTNAYVTVGPRARAVLEGKLKLEMGVAAITSKKTSAKSTSTTAETSFFDDDDGVEEDEDDVPLAQLAWNPMARKASTSTAAGKKRVAPVQAKPPPAADATSALFAELMAIRDQSSITEDCEPEAIISDVALQLIAALLPVSFASFCAIDGCDEEHYDWFVASGSKKLCQEASKGGPAPAAKPPTKPAPVSRPPAPPAPQKSARAATAEASSSRPKASTMAPKAKAKSTSSTKSATPAASTAKKPTQASLERFRFGAATGSGGKSGGGIKAMPMGKKR